MTVEIYDMKVREIGHFTTNSGKEYIVINQTYWYEADKYTDETASCAFLNRDKKTPEHGRKAEFVERELTDLLSAIDNDCLGAAYWTREDGEEFVTLIYANGAKKRVCVTADSIAAIARDVLKTI